MSKPLKNEHRVELERMFELMKASRESFRHQVGNLETKIRETIDKMGTIQLRIDALAAALGMPEGASRE